MKVIWQKETAGARIVALGTFDGVHRGHRELLDTAIRYAREWDRDGIFLLKQE